MVAGCIYVADGLADLLVLSTLPNVQFTVGVDATSNEAFTLEAATNLNAPIPWTPLVTTNVPVMPFDFVDFDMKLTNKPRLLLIRPPLRKHFTPAEQIRHRVAADGIRLPRGHDDLNPPRGQTLCAEIGVEFHQ